MSIHALSWAWKQTVGDAGAKLVLLKLADNANENGEAWPRQKRLATECEMSRPTVQRKLARLIESGLIEVKEQRREDGGQTSNVYRLRQLPPPQSEAPPRLTGDAPPASQVRHQEPSKEPSGASNDAPASSVSKQAVDDLFDAFQEEGMRAPSTKSQRSSYMKQVRECVAAGWTPETVRSLARSYRAHELLGKTMLTIFALCKWAGELEASGEDQGDRLRRRMAERGVS